MPCVAEPGAVAEKKSLRAAEQEQEKVAAERKAFWETVSAIDPACLVFLDESGADTQMVRLFARAPKGERACGSAPRGGYKRLTLIAGLGVEGLLAPMSIQSSTDTNVFLAYLDQVLIPELVQSKPGAAVVMDHLQPHHAPEVKRRLEAAGLKLLYLPPYSPDFSPVEHAWSKIKTILRSVAARTIAALEEAFGRAIQQISAADARGWFQHCGYVLN